MMEKCFCLEVLYDGFASAEGVGRGVDGAEVWCDGVVTTCVR